MLKVRAVGKNGTKNQSRWRNNAFISDFAAWFRNKAGRTHSGVCRFRGSGQRSGLSASCNRREETQLRRQAGRNRVHHPARHTQRHHLHRWPRRSEEHTSELQSRLHLVCRLLLEKKKQNKFLPTANLTPMSD